MIDKYPSSSSQLKDRWRGATYCSLTFPPARVAVHIRRRRGEIVIIPNIGHGYFASVLGADRLVHPLLPADSGQGPGDLRRRRRQGGGGARPRQDA
jgi:hypothetical protein